MCRTIRGGSRRASSVVCRLHLLSLSCVSIMQMLFFINSRQQVAAVTSSSSVVCRRSQMHSFVGTLWRHVVIVEDVEPIEVLVKALVSDRRREVDPATRCLLLLLRSAQLHIRPERPDLPSNAATASEHRSTGVATTVSAHPAASVSDATASYSSFSSSSG